MTRVIVASENPVKLKAVELAFTKVFPESKFFYQGLSVPSGVSDQPMSDAETYKGALNRIKNAQKAYLDAEFYVGIEGGIEAIHGNMLAFAWVVVASGKTKGSSKTSTFFLPPRIAKLIAEGKELGEADDIVFGLQNSKQQNGAVGILTQNVMTRMSYYSEALVLALIPFVHPKLYEEFKLPLHEG